MLNRLHCFFLNHDHFREDRTYDTTIVPDQDSDTLFVCFYILTYGLVEYQKNTHMMNRSLERQLKFKCIDYLSKRLTGTKKSATDLHYESQLGTSKYIDLPTFFALCEAYNTNVVFIHGNRYYTNGMDDIHSSIEDKDVPLLCISNITGSGSKEPSYYLKTVRSKSIPWDTMYKLHTLTSPLPPIRTMSKNDIIQLIHRFEDTPDRSLKDMNKDKKTHLYAHAETLLKLI